MIAVCGRQLLISECAKWDAILPSILKAILKKNMLTVCLSEYTVYLVGVLIKCLHVHCIQCSLPSRLVNKLLFCIFYGTCVQSHERSTKSLCKDLSYNIIEASHIV